MASSCVDVNSLCGECRGLYSELAGLHFARARLCAPGTHPLHFVNCFAHTNDIRFGKEIIENVEDVLQEIYRRSIPVHASIESWAARGGARNGRLLVQMIIDFPESVNVDGGLMNGLFGNYDARDWRVSTYDPNEDHASVFRMRCLVAMVPRADNYEQESTTLYSSTAGYADNVMPPATPLSQHDGYGFGAREPADRRPASRDYDDYGAYPDGPVNGMRRGGRSLHFDGPGPRRTVRREYHYPADGPFDDMHGDPFDDMIGGGPVGGCRHGHNHGHGHGRGHGHGHHGHAPGRHDIHVEEYPLGSDGQGRGVRYTHTVGPADFDYDSDDSLSGHRRGRRPGPGPRRRGGHGYGRGH